MQTAFVLDRKTLHRCIITAPTCFVAILVVGGSALLWLLRGPVDAIGLSFAVCTVVLFYVLARAYTWVSLDQEGLLGPLNPTFPRTRIHWHQPVVIRSVTRLGLPCLQVVVVSGIGSIVIPKAITQSSQFHRSISAIAPQEHPLRRLTQSGV